VKATVERVSVSISLSVYRVSLKIRRMRVLDAALPLCDEVNAQLHAWGVRQYGQNR